MKLKPTIKNVHTVNCISRDSLSQDSCVLPTRIPNRSALEFVYVVTGNSIMLEIFPKFPLLCWNYALCFPAPLCLKLCLHNRHRPTKCIKIQKAEYNFVNNHVYHILQQLHSLNIHIYT